jgi:peptidoglycan/xylan/chitin deacetylase (PgdA/CDA1 family)
MLNLHIDRTVSVYLCHPFTRGRNGGRRRLRIPILMYHSIREGQEGRHPYYETNTSPRVFAQHMKFLHENGYRALSLDKALQTLTKGDSSLKSVVITFDDGFADFYSHAFPILSEHGFTATMFVVTGLLKTQRTCFKGKECLTLSEVRELHSQGISIGSHTVTHPDLKLLPQDEVENELSGSKKTLEDALGAPIKSFAYPFAFPEADRRFVSRLADLLNKCGYENGVTTILGTAHPGANRWFLPRLPVNTWDDPAFFQAKLEGAYDWLHRIQLASKILRSRAS